MSEHVRKRIRDPGQVFLQIRAGAIDFPWFRQWLEEYRRQPVPPTAEPRPGAGGHPRGSEAEKRHLEWCAKGCPTPVEEPIIKKGEGVVGWRKSAASMESTYNNL